NRSGSSQGVCVDAVHSATGHVWGVIVASKAEASGAHCRNRRHAATRDWDAVGIKSGAVGRACHYRTGISAPLLYRRAKIGKGVLCCRHAGLQGGNARVLVIVAALL